MINRIEPVPNELVVRKIGEDSVQIGLADIVREALANPTVVSVTSADLSAASDKAASVDAALKSAINIVSNAVSDEISNRTSAVDAVSNALSNTISLINGVSARSVGDVSTHGLQSVVDALSNRISAGGGGASVTSQEVSALVQVASAAATSADAHAATASAAATSADAHANTASAAATSADAHANTVSARVVSVSAELASLVQIASAAATSADGHANTVSARVVSVSAELGSLIQIASAAATSADNHANTVSAAANTISARVVSVSAELASLVQIASAAATSADGHANTVSARVVSVSAELGSLIQIASAAATSADGHANTVSARAVSISAELVSLLNSVENRLSDRIDAIPGGGSTNVVRIRSNVVSVVSGTALTDLAGLSVSVSVGVLYKLEGAVMFEKATSGGAAFGLSLPPMAGGGNFVEMKIARLINQRGNMENSTIQDRFWGAATFSAVAALQTAIVSVSIEAVNTLRACEVRGMIITSATGTIQLMARGSVATDSISVRAGYLRVYKLG